MNEKQKIERKIQSKEKKAQNNVDDREIFTANRAMINVGPGKTHLVFFNDSPQKKLGDSEVHQCPVEIQMTKSVWLELIDEMTLKTVIFLMQNKCKDSKEIQENTEVMFR